jgi:hypothetical protein
MRVFVAIVAAVFVFAAGLAWFLTLPVTQVREVGICSAMAEFEDALPSEMPKADGELTPERFCATPFEKGFVSATSTGVRMVGVTADGLVLESKISGSVPFAYHAEAVRRSGDTILIELQLDIVVPLMFLCLAIMVGIIVAAILG